LLAGGLMKHKYALRPQKLSVIKQRCTFLANMHLNKPIFNAYSSITQIKRPRVDRAWVKDNQN
jgi:hypothetical protein